jgi:peptidyl-prolyl cis-trans isomerase SurA
MRVLSSFFRLATFALALSFGQSAIAQNSFGTAASVNDRVITNFEVDQRLQLLTVFRTPGADRALARSQLIEDRLKRNELNRAGLTLSDEALQTALEEFAARANFSVEQFTQILGQNRVEFSTLRDFVEIGTAWRDYIRSRFGSQTAVTEADINRAIGATTGNGSGIEVLLSEIIIPAPPPRAAQALATAQSISQIRTTSAFEAQARRVSALPSRNNGGRLGWLPLTNYPPQLRSLLLGLGTGEVTPPIPITNGVALFQLRGVREVAQPQQAPASIEYAAYYISGGAAGQAAAAELALRVDTCDDLYGIAQGQPAEVLERDSLAPSEIPQDVALELARLDSGEVSYNLTRSNGETIVFLMLCNRIAIAGAEVDRAVVENQLRSQRLAGFADALLENLRASANIVIQ